MVKLIKTEMHVQLHFTPYATEYEKEIMKTYGFSYFNKQHCWTKTLSSTSLAEAENLVKAFNPISNDINPLDRLEIHRFDAADVVIRSNGFYCSNHHELEDMAGEFTVCLDDGRIFTYKAPIAFCKTCNLYYILESTYEEIKKKGTILCQIMTYENYINKDSYPKYSKKWHETSPLSNMGYNVNQNDDLYPAQRHVILAQIIDNKICSVDRVLSYLDSFIKSHPGCDEAICRWKSDMKFVREYKLNSLSVVPVRRLIKL